MKKLLLSLLLIWSLIINFSSAEKLNVLWNIISSSAVSWSLVLDTNSIYILYANYNSSTRSVYIDFQDYQWTLNTNYSPLYFSVGSSDNVLNYVFNWWSFNEFHYDKLYSLTPCDYSDYELKSNITEGYCTNLYNNLIPVENIDQNYCVDNHLCPSYDCPSNTWDLQWSALYINNIQHVGAPLINISIPEEIEWNYTWSSSQFDLDVVWYNVDTEYVEWIIDTQNYIPSSSDFTRIFWLFWNYAWLLVSCLFVIIFFYFIKKLL